MTKVPRISEAEWAVMRALWDQAPQTANDVVNAVAGVNGWGPATVKTLLNRLVNKGALRFEQDGPRYRYYPSVSEDACIRHENRTFLERVYGGALTPMLARFLEDTPLTRSEIRALRKLLDEKGKRQ
jgi:BlaI family transcriptional regulator, penicillinase repressor